jgi:flagellar protein FlbT
MSATIRISLHAGERIFINGAVLRVDRKVSLELLNEVTFLLESHVLQPEDATTPLKQLYFVLQSMLMDPGSAEETSELFRQMTTAMLSTFDNPRVLAGLKFADGMVAAGRPFEALKTIRSLFPIEERTIARTDMMNLQLSKIA